jgi:PAS domain S-box-containing protein
MAPDGDVAAQSRVRKEIPDVESALLARQPGRQIDDERFRLVADAAPFFVWTASPDAQCTFANRAWLELRGRTLEDETGNGWTDGLHPDDRDLCVETYLKSFGARQAFRLTVRVLKATGEYTWVHANGTPYFDNGGEFAGFIASGIDISEWRRPFFTPDEEAARAVLALTERERQVLVLIANGYSTKGAAASLGVSYKTADSHRSRILEKLGVHETASMVRCAIRAGLIAP